jgi:hypothetical protein
VVIDPKRLMRQAIDLNRPCPCGGGSPAAVCCLGADGNVRKLVASVQPRPPTSGDAQNGCYLSHTNDCGGGMSREHYISETVLEQLSEPAVAIDGVFWLPPGERKVVGINSLTANILCVRHNSALSALDAEAANSCERLKTSTRHWIASRYHGDDWCRSSAAKRWKCGF